ncbi:MAG: response regulator [Hyphomonadaceae bacterium]|nr:response regulator [Hyphomonadaceae bacterium]
MSLTILVAEDQPDNREILIRRLERQTFIVIPAEDGAQAVEAFARQTPDLVLMDLAMPVMGGMEAMKRIRATETGKKTPIVALTAHAMDGAREDCLAAGFDAFATKPVDFPALMQLIRELTANKA